MTPAIEVMKLTKLYGSTTAVRDLDLSVSQGELFSLLGVNGAGKTTAIKMLTCLIRPTSGNAVLLGHSILFDPDAVKAKTNVSPQETAVARNLTTEENLQLMAEIYGSSRATARNQTAELLAKFGLTDVARKRAKVLSGGMQRRLSIAMALISDPEILFLDEPTLGLDVLARRELWKAIRELKGRVTMILTTHYMEEAEALSDRVGVLVKGSLKAVGTSAELVAATGGTALEDAFIALATGGEATT
ncbi:MAG: ATP-binding cassette domain-containing protein [Candidatus Bipolaricaulota bacterium]